jgi:hypothetical protein
LQIDNFKLATGKDRPMPLACRQCSRANPPDATYCYWDGAILEGHARTGAVNVGAQAFPSPFVFPNGQQCRNFDQLATACQQNWNTAVDLLKQGFLASFLGGMGRIDLAQAAQEAARFPDVERGLDQLLSKLPTHVLQEPKLKAEPSEINLGQVPLGTERTLELHLTNQGMRLLYGSVVSDSKWLTLGDGQGTSQRIFQFGADMTIPVQIRGQHLRAGAKPLEGNLIIESNGGQTSVTVRADVPAKPFPDGVLSGAISPRQIAEKAKAAAQASVPLFESGAVSRWFTDNGWQYPVQGPTAAGLGAVQQFFEALGLAKAPKLELKTTSLNLKGQVGQFLNAEVEVFSQEKRPVYAYGTVDQPWLDASRPKLSGRHAVIAVQVHVPNRPGEKLQANIRLMGNGNQKFTVPVSLTVEANPFGFDGGGHSSQDEFVPVMAASVPAPVPVAAAAAPFVPVMAAGDEIVETVAAVPMAAAPPPPVASFAPASMQAVQAVPVQAVPVLAAPSQAVSAQPFVATLSDDQFPAEDGGAVATRKPRQQKTPVWMHLLPLGVLALALVIVMVRDLFSSRTAGGQELPIDPTPMLGVKFDFPDSKNDAGLFTKTPSFGIYKFGDPGIPLTFTIGGKEYPQGRTNSMLARIDGRTVVLGDVDSGTYVEPAKDLLWENDNPAVPKALRGRKKGMRTIWRFTNLGIQIAQTVELVPGEPIEIGPGEYKRQVDTCLIHYRVKNADSKEHKVGVRFLLDTLIGVNDEPFFAVPGFRGIVDTCQDFPGKDRTPIPDFVQALENKKIEDPGTVAQLNLRLSDPTPKDGYKILTPNIKFKGTLEPPSRLSLTRWYKSLIQKGKIIDLIPKRVYDIPLPWELEPPDKIEGFNKDSAVVIYWEEKTMRPGEERDMAFTYGLGDIQSKTGLSLTVRGNFNAGGELTVVALVGDPKPGETLTLVLPKDKLKVVRGSEKQEVPAAEAGKPSAVTWTISSASEGLFDLEVISSASNKVKKQKIRIRSASLF